MEHELWGDMTRSNGIPSTILRMMTPQKWAKADDYGNMTCLQKNGDVNNGC
jgi:hypothetical protein